MDVIKREDVPKQRTEVEKGVLSSKKVASFKQGLSKRVFPGLCLAEMACPVRRVSLV